MATKGGNRGDDGETQIRFILLDAKGKADDLQLIAQAIATAVRPTTVIQQIAGMPLLATLPGIAPQQSEVPDPTIFASIEPSNNGSSVTLPPKKSSSGPRKRTRVPSILELDLTSGPVPFAQFVQGKNPDNHSQRYLVIAAWFKEHRQISEIGIDHIYTCYRKLNLNVVEDVGSIFRGCKTQGWFGNGSVRGMYAINHVGLGKVNDLGSKD